MDVPGDSSTTSTLLPGETISGILEADGDRDWHRVDVIAGHTYVFNYDGPINSFERGFISLRSANRTNLTGDINQYRIFYTPNIDETVYLEAWTGNGTGSTGAYQVSASDARIDAIPGNGSTTGSLAIGVEQSFFVNFNGDADWFAIGMAANATHYLTVTPGRLGAIYEDVDINILDGNGSIVSSHTVSSSDPTDDVIEFTVPTAQGYYVEVVYEDYFSDDTRSEAFTIRLDSAETFSPPPPRLTPRPT